MGVVKRSVSVEADVWDSLVAEAGKGSVSPLANDAHAHVQRRRQGLATIAAYEAEHGAFTEEELAEADRTLDEAGVVDVNAPPAPRARKRSSPKNAGGSRAAT
jgi:hypothetical protein